MNCAKVLKHISPYLDGELLAAEQLNLVAHLQSCAKCRAVAAEMLLQRQLFAQGERFTTPVGFRARVMANLESAPAPGLWWLRTLTGFAEIAVLVVIIFTGIASGSFLAERLAPGKTAAVTASLGLDLFDLAPPDSLGGAYLVMTEVRDEK